MRASPEQLSRLTDLRKLTHQRIAGLFRLRDYYDAHRSDHQPPPAQLLANARVSPDILLAVNALATTQANLSQERSGESESRRLKFRIAIGVCIGAALLGGSVVMLLFATGVVRRIRQLEASASLLERGEAPQAAFTGNDELGHLAIAMEKAGAILATRNRELQLALETAKLLIWELAVETRQIRYRCGVTTEDPIIPVELLAPTVDGWIAGVHADDRDEVRGEIERVLATEAVLNIEYRVVIRGGEIRWMTVRAQRQSATAGSPGRFLGLLADITTRRNAALEIESQARQLVKSKQALEEQTRILQSILDSMGDGVIVADMEGKFLVFNPAAEQMLGGRAFAGDFNQWSKHYGLFRSDGQTLYPTEDLPFVRAVHGESVDAAELLVKAAGSSERQWVSITARPLRDENGQIRGGVMVFRNITPTKRNAEALEAAKHEAETANLAKSEFLSRMSHELRTPLNSILGFAQLLELASLAEVDRDNLNHILKGGYHLLDLINEVLDLARIEAGRLSLSPEPVGMREILRDALDLVRPLAAERNVRLAPATTIRCDRQVRADRQRLKQVLLNLLSNAIKFNRDGGAVILSCEELAGNRLRIEIADSGNGISEEGLQKIFKPFERLAADQSDVGGTGLGLALSKRLIEAMGGTIGVHSAAGVGSRFFIDLDLLEDPSESLDNNPVVLETAGPDSRRATILYIEDNLSNLRLIERIMAHSPDVQVITAMQGQLGIDLAQIHHPDWILLDVHLPDLSGEEVLRRLRQNPRTRDIPVTVLSADATRSQISRMLSAGARDYLTKPLDVHQLLRLLDETLKPAGAAGPMETVHAERHHPE